MTATTLQLRFFASVREQLGCSEQVVVLPSDITTVGQVRQWLIGRGGVWAETLAPGKPLRIAYQQVMCDESEPLVLSDLNQEVAFFPPVTGG
jgi:molybdopterin synthase sulfur carrier subunit